MTDILTAEDSLYEEFYDVRREAMDIGNLVEEDMNPKMNALRDRAPVHKGSLRDLLGLPPHHRYPGAADRATYTCFSFRACDAAFRDGARYSSTIMQAPNHTGEHRLAFLEMDGAEHREMRKTVQPMFLKPRTLTWWRERWINDIVGTLIEALKRRDRAELNLQLCARIPVHTISRASGMEGDDSLKFRSALLKSTAARHGPSAEQMAAAQTVERMLLDLIAKRRVVPADDLISAMIQTELALPDGTQRPLTDREIMLNCRLIILAGGGTSWRQFGITLWALLTHRDQLEAVKADRSLVNVAIEESVRWNATDPVFPRLTMEDSELDGVPVPGGAVLEVCLGAANRDPSRWEKPDAYNLHRPQQGHLGFAAGPHMCLGRDVARSEISVGLNFLLDAFPNLRLDPEAPAPYLTGGLEQRGMSAIPVLLR